MLSQQLTPSQSFLVMPADLFTRTLTKHEQKAEVQTALCVEAAICGDVDQLQAAMGPMSDDPDFLDGCLDALVAEAVPRCHMNILQHLATCKPGGAAFQLPDIQNFSWRRPNPRSILDFPGV